MIVPLLLYCCCTAAPVLLQELIKFAYDEKIVLMADEVYQENIYQDERPFVSARKVRDVGVVCGLTV
jgi:glutamate--glyoxylate aminotransferase